MKKLFLVLFASQVASAAYLPELNVTYKTQRDIGDVITRGYDALVDPSCVLNHFSGRSEIALALAGVTITDLKFLVTEESNGGNSLMISYSLSNGSGVGTWCALK